MTINTIIKEKTIQSELAVFWDEIASSLPKSMERSALGDEKVFKAFASAYPKMRDHLFRAGAAAMLQRVRDGVAYEGDDEGNISLDFLLSHLDTLQKEIEGNDKEV